MTVRMVIRMENMRQTLNEFYSKDKFYRKQQVNQASAFCNKQVYCDSKRKIRY